MKEYRLAFDEDPRFRGKDIDRRKEPLVEATMVAADGETATMFNDRVSRASMRLLHLEKERITEETGLPSVGVHVVSSWGSDLLSATITVFRYR